MVVMPLVNPAVREGGLASVGSRRKTRSTFLIAFGVQAALLALTLFIMVKKETRDEPPAFRSDQAFAAEKLVKPTDRNVKDLRRRMSKPRNLRLLAVSSSAVSDLPPIPALPQDAFSNEAMDLDSMGSADSLLGDSDWMASMGGMAGRASATEFFGVKDSGQRIVIVVNTSASVLRRALRRGVTMEEIQRQAISLIGGLESGTRFGIVQFSQGARSFSDQLAPGLKKNKRLAEAWVLEKLKGNPPIEDEQYLGHEAGMHRAIGMLPDLVFLVTDGSLNRRVRSTSGAGYSYPKISFDRFESMIAQEMREAGVKARIHVIGFELTDAEREGLAKLAKRFGGSLREF